MNVRDVDSLSKKKKPVRPVEKKKATFDKKAAAKKIDQLPFVSPDIKRALKENLDLPERVAKLEKNMLEIALAVDKLPTDIVAEMKKEAEKRQAEGPAPGPAPNQQTSPADQSGIEKILNHPVVIAIARHLGGGSSPMDAFFLNLGRETFIKGMAFQDVFYREQAKGMGKAFFSDWKARQKELGKQLGVKEGKKE